MTWIIAIISFAIGLCVGAALFRQFKSDRARVQQIQDKLDQTRAEFEDYRKNVQGHFVDTAQLMENLADTYKDVYRHLASNARKLCNEDVSNQLAFSAQEKLDIGESRSEPSGSKQENPDSPPFPPRDYADKKNPEQKGGLSEDYGLK